MAHCGIHHITAIAGPARRNLDFYTGTLGLRLVKKTVNFDDPGTYHFYFGDTDGSPGSILTFFPWAHAAPGRLGVGETSETVFRVPGASVGYWIERLIDRGVAHEAPDRRFGETVVAFKDPDGTRLALAGVAGIEGEPAWAGGTVPAEHAIRGFHSAVLLLAEAGPTASILTSVLGFREEAREDSTLRLRADGTAVGGIVDIRAVGGFLPSRTGAGTVHHIAFRAADDADQARMVEALRGHGIRTTEQKDRNYFRSVYFREPGGVLFEIATDVPGFATDEARDQLGRALKLPGFLEPQRRTIEAMLPEVA